MTSTSSKVGGVFGKYGVLNAVVNDLYLLAQKSKSAKIPVKGDLIMFSSHCTFKYKTLSFCHKMSWAQRVEDWVSNWPPKFCKFCRLVKLFTTNLWAFVLYRFEFALHLGPPPFSIWLLGLPMILNMYSLEDFGAKDAKSWCLQFVIICPLYAIPILKELGCMFSYHIFWLRNWFIDSKCFE